jgi:hypothetical protein
LKYDQIKNTFLGSSKEWVSDGYSVSIRFVASVDEGNLSILEAEILLAPILSDINNSFLVKKGAIFLGQIDINAATEKELTEIIENASRGIIKTPEGDITLEKDSDYSFYSETNHRELWFYQLHLSIVGLSNTNTMSYDLTEIDNILRLSSPPFDGLKDAEIFLGLKGNKLNNRNPSINIRISPPVDLIFNECSLCNDEFSLVLHAHHNFNINLLNVALRAVPGLGLKSRFHISTELKWDGVNKNICKGTASIKVKDADSVMIMLMVGNTTVRRQWFLDPNKSRNNRLLAVQHFDQDLKMIRHAVLETTNSPSFENGISALLFLLGFSPCVQIETDSPDIIVQTPSGRIILVECTLKISDFSTKLGKLVDRRGALTKSFEKIGHMTSISAALVCRLPRDQIAAKADDLASHNAILITQEILNEAFSQVRNHNDPDEMLDKAELEIKKDSQMSLRLSAD